MTLLDPIIHYLLTCGKKTVALAEVAEAAERERRQVLRVMDKLALEGFLKEISDDPQPLRPGELGPQRRNPTWRIVRDLTGRPAPNPPRPQSLRSKLWRLIRGKHRFTKTDLACCSGISMASVDEYVRDLERAGYVRRTGKDGALVTYIVAKPNQISPPTGLFGGAK